ncbi:MAG: hypothetical protein ISS19_03060 [Bacteroidales bacterium]|nr:hypothetical protein [Bacteroidales bacterium]
MILPFILSLLYSSILVLALASQWAVYEKAGRAGWICLVPIWNLIVLLEIVGKPWWWLFLFMLPIVNVIWAVWMTNMLSKSFGYSEGFTVGLILLSFVFYPILGFGQSKYIGPYGAGGTDPANPPDIKKPVYDLNNWIIAIVLFMFVNSLFWFFLRRFVRFDPMILNYFLTFLFGLIPLISAGLIKDKTWKILLIILGTLYFAMQMAQLFEQLFRGIF